jgi:hypothetical protein
MFIGRKEYVHFVMRRVTGLTTDNSISVDASIPPREELVLYLISLHAHLMHRFQAIQDAAHICEVRQFLTSILVFPQ